ncbi:hypothetical protein C8024_02655 [Sphingopyxis sp. BSNA05]|nr:hypothetical protein [Sphingopyxis sp. BSNA05]
MNARKMFSARKVLRSPTSVIGTPTKLSPSTIMATTPDVSVWDFCSAAKRGTRRTSPMPWVTLDNNNKVAKSSERAGENRHIIFR